jgi:hypothetical protein
MKRALQTTRRRVGRHRTFMRLTLRWNSMSKRRSKLPLVAALIPLVALVVLSLAYASHADARFRPSARDALPRMAERLAHPITLVHCGTIVEWKPTLAFREETLPSGQALAVIDEACRVATERYPGFLRSKGIAAKRATPDMLPSISLLPANVLLDGRDPRSLNDIDARFGGVVASCCYWGLYVDNLRHLFLRNDPLVRDHRTGQLRKNDRFVRTLQHEIAHVMSARLGAFIDRRRDEELAEEFVAYLGITFVTESSSDDLAFHEGRR